MSEKFAVKKSWLLDIQSVNLSEIFGATLGVVALMFGWKKHEKEEFANLSSSLILGGAVGANPILLIVSIVSWAKSYTKDKNKKAFKEGTIKGLLGMGSFIMTTSLFASPLLGIIIGLVVLIVVKKQLKKIEVSEIYDWFRDQIKKHGKTLAAMGGGAGVAMMMGAI
jgi:ammonia channel protein AmtB